MVNNIIMAGVHKGKDYLGASLVAQVAANDIHTRQVYLSSIVSTPTYSLPFMVMLCDVN